MNGSTRRTLPSQDEDGYFWYVGRADDVIIAAGYRIGPFEVESACLEHPAVREAAAVASPDELRGNVVKAFVVLADGYAPTDDLAEEIKGYVRGRLSAYAYPRLVEFVPDLPKTLTGKIRRVELRQLELDRAGAAPEHVIAAEQRRTLLRSREAPRSDRGVAPRSPPREPRTTATLRASVRGAAGLRAPRRGKTRPTR